MEQRVTEPSNHRALRTLIMVLIGVGLALWAWRYWNQPEAVAAPGDRLWEVYLGIRATAAAGKTAVEMAAPLNTRHLRVVGQNIDHHGWRQSFRVPDDPESSRRIIFVASTSGDLSIDVLFDVQELAASRIGKDVGSRALDNDERELFLRDHPTLTSRAPGGSGRGGGADVDPPDRRLPAGCDLREGPGVA